MSKLQYEKNNTVTSLKNEIYGIKQLIDILNNIKALDFSKLEKKVINVKLEKFINEKIGIYSTLEFSYTNEEKIGFLVNNRYNLDTKSYISFYDRRSFCVGYNVDEKGKHRLNTEKTIQSIDEDIKRLKITLKEFEEELKNIDSIVEEYEKIYNMMKDFSSKRTSFFKDNFKQSNGFY